ncbi:hypothetical protein Tsubulata_043026 [Turnera subulata]|uniref:Uncharacterized protein n=1 Tax=Turnera subulata TaxID=218843 RepID=A0A9Q0JD66_9ROSI|nr:hypothetical protein Tsubulata_043026 [Turnera subulata]
MGLVEARVGLCARGLEGRRDWIVTTSVNGMVAGVYGIRPSSEQIRVLELKIRFPLRRSECKSCRSDHEL